MCDFLIAPDPSTTDECIYGTIQCGSEKLLRYVGLSPIQLFNLHPERIPFKIDEFINYTVVKYALKSSRHTPCAVHNVRNKQGIVLLQTAFL